jgi:cold shock CspA family protein
MGRQLAFQRRVVEIDVQVREDRAPKSLYEGQQVTMEVTEGPKGLQAQNVTPA